MRGDAHIGLLLSDSPGCKVSVTRCNSGYECCIEAVDNKPVTAVRETWEQALLAAYRLYNRKVWVYAQEI